MLLVKRWPKLGGGEIELSSDALQEYIAVESRDWEKIYEYLKSVN
jgi:hypothetical protein